MARSRHSSAHIASSQASIGSIGAAPPSARPALHIITAMAILKVARMGHPVLRAKARPVDAGEIKSPRIQQLIDDMFETMREYQGIGLAAPQVHESVRLFVAGFAPTPMTTTDERRRRRCRSSTVINPEIAAGRPTTSSRTGKAASASPTSAAWCRAPATSRVRAFDRTGKRIELRAPGLARARHPARDRSSRRRAVLRSHDDRSRR